MKSFFKISVQPNKGLFLLLVVFTCISGTSLPFFYHFVSSTLNLFVLGEFQRINVYLIILAAILTTWVTCSLIFIPISRVYTKKVVLRVRDMVIRKTLAQDIESFKNEGQFLSWFINDAAAIKAAAMLLPVLITYSFMVVALIGLGFFQNFITGLLMMVTVSISVLLTLLFKKRLSQLGVDISDIKNSRTSKLNNWLQGQDIFLLSTKFSAFKRLIVFW